MSFILTDDQQHVRLKSYDAKIKGKIATLSVTVEVTDTFELGMLLRGLERLMEETARPQRAKQPPEPPQDITPRSKKLSRQPPLALPPPDRSEFDL